MISALLGLALVATPMDQVRSALHCDDAGTQCTRPELKKRFVITHVIELERQLFVGVAQQRVGWGQSVEATLEFELHGDGEVSFSRCHERETHDSRQRFTGHEVSLCTGKPRVPDYPVAPRRIPPGVVGPHDWSHPLVLQEYALLDAVFAHAPTTQRRALPGDMLFGRGRFMKPDGGFRQLAISPPTSTMRTVATVVFELTADEQVVSAECWSRLPANGQHLSTLQLAPIAFERGHLTFEDSCEETETSRLLVTYDVAPDGTLSLASRRADEKR